MCQRGVSEIFAVPPQLNVAVSQLHADICSIDVDRLELELKDKFDLNTWNNIVSFI